MHLSYISYIIDWCLIFAFSASFLHLLHHAEINYLGQVVKSFEVLMDVSDYTLDNTVFNFVEILFWILDDSHLSGHFMLEF